MSARIPRYIDPIRLARDGAIIEGTVPLADMGRLQDMVEDTGGTAEVRLEFGRDDLGKPCVEGRVGATLTVVCQRCLESMSLRVDTETRLALLEPGEPGDRLAPGFEPYVVEHPPVALSAMVEDELILALPAAPLHDEAVCSIADRYRNVEEADERERENPFAVLADLRTPKT